MESAPFSWPPPWGFLPDPLILGILCDLFEAPPMVGQPSPIDVDPVVVPFFFEQLVGPCVGSHQFVFRQVGVHRD